MSYTKQSISKNVQRRLDQIRKFLKSVNQCPLCAEPLTLIHEKQMEKNEVKETAHCSKCSLDVRKKQHTSH